MLKGTIASVVALFNMVVIAPAFAGERSPDEIHNSAVSSDHIETKFATQRYADYLRQMGKKDSKTYIDTVNNVVNADEYNWYEPGAGKTVSVGNIINTTVDGDGNVIDTQSVVENSLIEADTTEVETVEGNATINDGSSVISGTSSLPLGCSPK